MKPIEFEQSTHTLAENQPEYLPLPVHVDTTQPEVPITSCWQLTPEEIAQLQANGGRIYVTELTFGHRFMPLLVSLAPPADTLATMAVGGQA